MERQHYSSDRSLILEFHSDHIQSNNSGFRGRFKFLKKGTWSHYDALLPVESTKTQHDDWYIWRNQPLKVIITSSAALMTRNMLKVHVLTLTYLLYFRAMATCDHHVGWCVIIVLAQFQIQGGIPVWGDDCAYEFSSIINQTGRLFSPKYPQHYPPLAHCRYTFIGMGERTRVKVVFTSIALASSDRRYALAQS